MAKEKVFAIFGLGTFGLELCRALSEKGANVIAFDNQQELVDRVDELVTEAICIDSTAEDELKNAPLETIDTAIVSIGENIESSILTTALLKKLGVPQIIARATTDLHKKVLEQVGAAKVVNIEIEEGKRLANELLTPDIISKMIISQEQALAEIIVPEDFVGKTISSLNIRQKFNINIISIKRIITKIDDLGNPQREPIIITPKPNEPLKENDILVAIGSEKALDQLMEL